jgi:multicomponent Na+:H+ antiporter subunit F
VNVWLVGATVLLFGLVPCAYICLRRSRLDGVVAVQLAGTVTTVVLVLLAEGYRRPSYFVVPIVLAGLSFVGGLVFVRFIADRRL